MEGLFEWDVVTCRSAIVGNRVRTGVDVEQGADLRYLRGATLQESVGIYRAETSPKNQTGTSRSRSGQGSCTWQPALT